MASIIGAGTTAGTSLNLSGDTTGVLQFATNGTTTAMTIDTSQNVGIGTSSPSFKLQITGANNNTGGFADGIRVTSNNGSVWKQYTWTGLDTSDQHIFAINGTERMRIDSAGRVTMVSQPAFSARSFSNTSPGVKTFSTIPLNVGSHYNNSNGRFTAPVAGEYFISCSYLVQSGFSDIQFGIRVNGADWAELKTGGSTVFTTSWSGVIPLATNDFVEFNYVSASTSATVTGNAFGQFSGFLLG